MNIDGKFDTITGLTAAEQGSTNANKGTKIHIRWQNGRTTRVKLTSIDVTYKKISK